MIFHFPGPRQQFDEPVDEISLDHAFEHVGEIAVRFDTVQFATNLTLDVEQNVLARQMFGQRLASRSRSERVKEPRSRGKSSRRSAILTC
jgi:hypothetical protein